MRKATPGGPYCIIWRVEFGYVRTMRVPEDFIPRITKYGWRVLITDTEVLYAPSVDGLQSNPQRHDQPDGYSEEDCA